jgi:hypothetical protein
VLQARLVRDVLLIIAVVGARVLLRRSDLTGVFGCSDADILSTSTESP